MSTDSSLPSAFDLDSQPGVMAVLASIRASQLSTAEKNELRDLVFSYANGGGDSSVRIALMQKLSAHHITPTPIKVKTPPAPDLAFGTYRPTPSFKQPTLKEIPVPEPVVAPVTPEPVTKAETTPTPTPTPTLTPTPTPTPVPTPESVKNEPPVTTQTQTQTTPTQQTPTPVPEATQTPVATPNLTPNPAPATPIAPVTPRTEVVQTPVVAPAEIKPVETPITVQEEPKAVVKEPVPTPTPTPTPIPAPEDPGYLNRIREIKTAVNSRVGNPVNLVDIDNAVGREYMNALLEAMKKLSSGAVSEMGRAMERLELAYKAVEVTLDKHDSGSIKPEVPPPTETKRAEVSMPKPIAEPLLDTRVQPVQNKPKDVEEEKAIPTSNPNSSPVEPTLPIRENLASVSTPLPVRAVVEEEPVSVSSIPVQSQVTVPPKVSESTEPEQVTKPEESDTKSGYEIAGRASDPVPKPAPIATEEGVNTVVGATEAEYFTPEVDAGLQQLLSDWSLFKKSGLFGNGPTGREHPLYKKIADLNVPLLLAGRFEGATQEIRQSITDYMNGWRYEQGIIYKPGETFEIYLRRVIRHILDLQNKRHHS